MAFKNETIQGQVSSPADCIQSWGMLRDTCQWDLLAALYTPDATMAVSWFDGSAKDFIDGCRKMAANGNGQFSSQHLINNSIFRFNRTRCLAETRMSVLLRLSVAGTLCDVTAIGRFNDQFVMHDGQWLIHKRTAIFEKDMIQPVIPGHVIAIDEDLYHSYPSAFGWCAYTLAQRGAWINTNLPTDGSQALATLSRNAEQWLANASQ